MKITILQTDTVWASPDANIIEAERLMDSAGAADLFVLPEMWSTGFAVCPEGVAEKEPVSVNWMMNMARKHDAAICGSVAIDYDGIYYNRHYFCLPDGTTYSYDKHHLFKYGGEDRYYERGNGRVVAEYMGVRFLLVTCYDIRFPEWCRCRGDYDAVVCVANWPEQRMLAWETLIRARAIENECMVIAANRVGDDEHNHYVGRSAIINAYGQTLAVGGDNMQEAVSADFDLEMQEHYRKKFPVLDEMEY